MATAHAFAMAPAVMALSCGGGGGGAMMLRERICTPPPHDPLQRALEQNTPPPIAVSLQP
jgi:hypothetical protein